MKLYVRLGSNSEAESHSRRVRSTPMNGHRQTGPTGPFRARSRHRLAYPITSSASAGVRLGPLRGA